MGAVFPLARLLETPLGIESDSLTFIILHFPTGSGSPAQPPGRHCQGDGDADHATDDEPPHPYVFRVGSPEFLWT